MQVAQEKERRKRREGGERRKRIIFCMLAGGNPTLKIKSRITLRKGKTYIYIFLNKRK